MISDHLERFCGLPAVDLDPRSAAPDPSTAVRLAVDWDGWDAGTRIEELVTALAARPEAASLRALVIGAWDFESSEDSQALVDALVAAAPRLESLRALFVGDIVYEEQEISWIKQSNLTRLLAAYPRLESLGIRGGDGLALDPFEHASLRELVVESGGLPGPVVAAVGASTLPELRQLELWLGTDEYGGTTTLADLVPIFAGTGTPRLEQLGLRDADLAGAIAAAIVDAPILSRLQALDLSLGTLCDPEVEPWLHADSLRRLARIDVAQSFISAPMLARLRASGLAVVGDDQREPDSYNGNTHRYVVHGE